MSIASAMLTSEQIERVENVLACDKEWHPASTVCVRKDDLTALLQLARAVSEAPRREVREYCGHLLVGNEWDEADAEASEVDAAIASADRRAPA